MFNKTKLFVSSLIIGSLMVTVPVRAFDRDDRCEDRIRDAERALHKAERKHGEHSRQADEKRHRLEEIREHCHHDHDDHDRR